MNTSRGRKSKPAGKLDRDGNTTHRSYIPDPLKGDVEPNGIDPPIKLKGRELHLWDNYIRKLPWLTFADVHTALSWVRLAKLLEETPKPSIHLLQQYRGAASSLGFDPSARNSRAVAVDATAAPKNKFESLIGKAA